MGTFTRDVAGLKSAFHPSMGGIGKWGIVERDTGVSITLSHSQLSAKTTTMLMELKADDPDLITRRFVVVGARQIGGKTPRFLDFYRVFDVETTGKTG